MSQTVWILVVDAGLGPQPFALFWNEALCVLVRDALAGVRAVCVAQVPGVSA